MAKVFEEKLYPKVKEAIDRPETKRMVDSTLKSYMEKNSSKLADIAPMNQILFGELEKNALYRAFDLNHNEVYNCMLESPDVVIKARSQTVNSFNLSCAIAIKCLLDKNDEDMLNKVLVLYGLSFYPSLYSKYFKHDPKEQIMQYVVNNLSNRYKLKQLGLFGVLKSTVEKCLDNNRARLKRGTDMDYVYFILDTKNRYNSFFNNIMDEFMKAHKNGKFVNLDSEDNSDENYREVDNSMYNISRLTDSVYMNLYIDGPNANFVKYASKMCQISFADLRTWIDNILADKKQEKNVRRVIEAILYAYLYENKNKVETIRSNNFLIKSLEEFKRTNSSNKNLKELKDIISLWLTDYSDVYSKTNRVATIIQYKRAIYIFFVMSIQSKS